MKNIHVIPTDKPSRLSTLKNKLVLFNTEGEGSMTYHIYITSDEEIKEGDWFLLNNPHPSSSIKNKIVKCSISDIDWVDYERNTFDVKQYPRNFGKKIILTTDQDLIADGVQAIDDEFLEWFVKNPSCEFVEWSSEKIEGSFDGEDWKFNYGTVIPQEEPKQETLEEADELVDLCNKINFVNPRERVAYYNGLKNGAKWQQEQDKNKYSEEDMIEFAVWMYLEVGQNSGKERTNKELFKEWFEQFKKK